MLDVHPPHEAAHTWKDFFLHIATIVIGLLIAVGLEQTVEAVHRHRERTELRHALHEESRKILNDCNVTRTVLTGRDSGISFRMEELRAILWKSHPANSKEPASGPYILERPDVPIWRTARTSGLAPLLTPEEIGAYSEVEMVAAKVETAYDRMVVLHANRIAFEDELPGTTSKPVFGTDLDPAHSKASSVDLREYLHLLSQEQMAILYLDRLVAGMSGAQTIILRNIFDVSQIRRSEQNRQSTQ